MAYINGKKVLQAVKVENGGGGGSGVELNLAYGLTPPTDTSKIWVRTDKTPTSVEITDDPTWSDEITSSVISSELDNVTDVVMVRAGEYVYMLGGTKDGVSHNGIKRYNTITGTIEDLNITLPFDYTGFSACSYKDYIYMFCGFNYDGTKYIMTPKVIIFNWKINKIVESKINPMASVYFTNSFNIRKNCYTLYGASGSSLSTLINYKYGTSLSLTFSSYAYKFDAETKQFLLSSSGGSANNRKSITTQKINKTICAFGGQSNSGRKGMTYWSYSELINFKSNKDINLSSISSGSTNIGYGTNNILLITNDKLFICGGQYGTTASNTPITDGIISYNISAESKTTTAYTLPYTLEWNSTQFDAQSSYGRSGQYLVKVENKIELDENKLMIIPDIDGEEEYDITIDNDYNLGYKTSIQNVYIGNANGEAELVRCYVYENESWKGINCDDYTSPTKLNFSNSNSWCEVSSGTSLESNIMCNVGDLIVASVIARDSGNETASEGWTLLGRSLTGNGNQTLAFYSKIATSKMETITITSSSSGRIYISLEAFTGKTTATIGTFKMESNANRVDFTLPNKLCVVSASTYLWGSSWVYYDPYHYETFNEYDYLDNASSQPRLATWIDYGGGGSRSIGSVTDGGNTLIVGYVEIS